MARNIDDIIKDLKDWYEEDKEERCYFFCFGEKPDDVELHTNGKKSQITSCIATMASSEEEVFEVLRFSLQLARNARDLEKSESE